MSFAFGDLGEPLGAMQEDLAVIGIGVDERLGVFAIDGARGGQHADKSRFGLRGGGLDGGDGADKGDRVTLAQGGERQGAGGIAGDDDEIRPGRAR